MSEEFIVPFHTFGPDSAWGFHVDDSCVMIMVWSGEVWTATDHVFKEAYDEITRLGGVDGVVKAYREDMMPENEAQSA